MLELKHNLHNFLTTYLFQLKLTTFDIISVISVTYFKILIPIICEKNDSEVVRLDTYVLMRH